MRRTVFINLTPHEIVVDNGSEKIKVEPSGKIARLISVRKNIGAVEGFTVEKIFHDGIKLIDQDRGVEITTYRGFVRELFEDRVEDGAFLVVIVSLPTLIGMARSNIPTVADTYIVVAPDTENAIRDESGRILAVPGFVSI